MSLKHSVELDDGHEVTVILSRHGYDFEIYEIDLERGGFHVIMSPSGGPFRSIELALAFAKQIAERELRMSVPDGPKN